MNWVGPGLLTQYLSTRDPNLPRELVPKIELTKRRIKKTDGEPPVRLFERKLSFSPFDVTSLESKDFEGEQVGYWDGRGPEPFNHEHLVICEMPEYWLQKVLPRDVLDPPPAQPKQRAGKRKQQADPDEQLMPSSTIKKKRTAQKQPRPSAQSSQTAASTT
jgi:Holliday junction resolvase YEN1